MALDSTEGYGLRGQRGGRASRIGDRGSLLLAAAATCALLVVPVAIAGSGSKEGGGASASADGGKLVKKLKKQISALTARVAALEGKPDQVGAVPASLPPSGPASGDLTGTYPSPLIGPNAVGSGNVAPNALTGADIREETLGGSVRWARVGIGGIVQLSTPENITLEARVAGSGIWVLDFDEPLDLMALHVTMDNQFGEVYVGRCDIINCGSAEFNNSSHLVVGTGTSAGAPSDRGFWVSASP